MKCRDTALGHRRDGRSPPPCESRSHNADAQVARPAPGHRVHIVSSGTRRCHWAAACTKSCSVYGRVPFFEIQGVRRHCSTRYLIPICRTAPPGTRDETLWTQAVRALGLEVLPQAFPWANSWANSGEPRGTGKAGSVLNQQPTFPLRPLPSPTEWVRVPSATPPRAADLQRLFFRRFGPGSTLGDEVLHADRLARQQVAPHALLQLLVGQRRARALVQVVGP